MTIFLVRFIWETGRNILVATKTWHSRTFMELVRDSNNGRFILTTREHVLRAALQMSERFARSPMLEHRYLLELDDYTFAHRARILYNHLYFSGLPQPYKEAVLAEDFFLEIIKHEHFN